MKSKITLLVICFGLIISACTQKEKTCVITGKVINRPQSTHLRLSKSFVDLRSKTAVLIPIVDNTFTHEIKFKDIEAFSLVFEDEFIKGAMRPITFFATNDTVSMTLFPVEEYEKNSINGGIENQQFIEHEKKKMDEIIDKTKPINDSLHALQRTNKFHSQIMKDLFEKLKNTEKQEDKFKMYNQINELYKSREGLSPAARKLSAQNDSIMKIIQDKELEFIRNNISISTYYSLIQAILNTEYFPDIFNFDELNVLQVRYAAKFKNHPYTNYSNEVLWRFANMKPGGNYYDVTLPDLNGKEYKLSEEIKGKYAFIDIWAPWCGPCISKSREMKPVFEEYKNKDFTVIGIASKYQEVSDVEKLLEKDKYPWITLIDKPELDSRINEHYGIEMAGGGCVLVDKAGKIVLVNPSVEEVKKVLEANL